MIARIWQGVTPQSKADAYLDYMNETGVKDLKSTEENRGVYVLRRTRDQRADFIFISLWETNESVHKFAGPDAEKAVSYPKDKDFLIELEPNVNHHEVVVEP